MKEEKMITASNKEVDEAVVPKKHDVLSRIKLMDMDTNRAKMFKTFSEWISYEVINNDQVLVQTDFGFMGKDIPLTIRFCRIPEKGIFAEYFVADWSVFESADDLDLTYKLSEAYVNDCPKWEYGTAMEIFDFLSLSGTLISINHVRSLIPDRSTDIYEFIFGILEHFYDSVCTGECIFGTVMILDKVAKNDNIPTITMNCEY